MRSAGVKCPESVDVVIIGGGITGAGIARDAALRGLKVALFEKGDYASGTSSKSSKLVHGGLRYLEQGEIALVFESVSERRVQTQVAPHLVRPLPFLVPIFAEQKPGLEIINIGLWLYDALALFRAPALHRTFRGARAALALEPKLRTEGLRGVIEYYDCATDDARMVVENIVDAQALGAYCGNYQEVISLERADGRIVAVHVRDRFTQATARVACTAVVLAAGAWTDEARTKLGIPLRGRKNLLRRTKGVHIVVPRERLPLDRTITLMSPVDGRVMFAIPWRDRTVLGTTDTDFAGSADEVAASWTDVDYLCASANGYFPQAALTPADVIATWAGLRPLIAGPEDADESDISREHEVLALDDGMVLIAGGKLTTYRLMAKQAVDAVVAAWAQAELALGGRALPKAGRSETRHRPLPGAVGLAEPSLAGVAAIGRELIDQHGFDTDTATHLCGVYGARARQLAQMCQVTPRWRERLDPELPYIAAEVIFAARYDGARTVEDVLARRVPLLLVSRDQGLGATAVAARLLAVELDWNAATEAAMVSEYQAAVALSRRWQTEAPHRAQVLAQAEAARHAPERSGQHT